MTRMYSECLMHGRYMLSASMGYACPKCQAGASGSTSALDRQEGGTHYKDMKIQPVQFIHANGIPFLDGNVIKYVCRHRAKNGKQDLLKARQYIDMLIELEYPDA